MSHPNWFYTANKLAKTVLKDWNIKVGNFVHVIFHESIETTLAFKETQKLELEDRGKIFNFRLMPVVEFGYINIYRRDITNTQKAEKQLKKNTLERNRSESEASYAGSRRIFSRISPQPSEV